MDHVSLFLCLPYHLQLKSWHLKKIPSSLSLCSLAACRGKPLLISPVWKIQVLSGLFWAYVFPGPVCVFSAPSSPVYMGAIQGLNYQKSSALFLLSVLDVFYCIHLSVFLNFSLLNCEINLPCLEFQILSHLLFTCSSVRFLVLTLIFVLPSVEFDTSFMIVACLWWTVVLGWALCYFRFPLTLWDCDCCPSVGQAPSSGRRESRNVLSGGKYLSLFLRARGLCVPLWWPLEHCRNTHFHCFCLESGGLVSPLLATVRQARDKTNPPRSRGVFSEFSTLSVVPGSLCPHRPKAASALCSRPFLLAFGHELFRQPDPPALPAQGSS